MQEIRGPCGLNDLNPEIDQVDQEIPSSKYFTVSLIHAIEKCSRSLFSIDKEYEG